jgi:hypothetical protein
MHIMIDITEEFKKLIIDTLGMLREAYKHTQTSPSVLFRELFFFISNKEAIIEEEYLVGGKRYMVDECICYLEEHIGRLKINLSRDIRYAINEASSTCSILKEFTKSILARIKKTLYCSLEDKIVSEFDIDYIDLGNTNFRVVLIYTIQLRNLYIADGVKLGNHVVDFISLIQKFNKFHRYDLSNKKRMFKAFDITSYFKELVDKYECFPQATAEENKEDESFITNLDMLTIKILKSIYAIINTCELIASIDEIVLQDERVTTFIKGIIDNTPLCYCKQGEDIGLQGAYIRPIIDNVGNVYIMLDLVGINRSE